MSKSRKYSVAEIDQMRDIVWDVLIVTRTVVKDAEATVESRLRTYMMNGTTKEELQAHLEQEREREKARQEQLKR